MKQHSLFLTALTLALTWEGGAVSAAVITPALGVSATEAVVAGDYDITDQSSPLGFHVTSGLGTPGVGGNYDPSGYFGRTASAVSGYDSTNLATAAGKAAVDLNSGQLHLFAQSVRPGIANYDSSVPRIGAAGALSDVITITGAIPAPVTVRLSLVVDGSINSVGIGGPAPNLPANGVAVFSLEGPGAIAELFLNQFIGGTVQEQNYSSNGGQVITDSGYASSLHFTMYDDVVVTDSSRSIPFVAAGSVGLGTPDSAGVITANFGNTARFEVALPNGLGFTSQSGVLLTSPQDTGGTSVPEPASFVMLSGCLIGAWIARCRRSGARSNKAGATSTP